MINWKLRLQNKVILTSIVLQVISIVYQILAASGVVPTVAESAIVTIAETIIGVLVLVGIVTDPTTAGASDSVKALGYNYCNIDTVERDDGDRSDDAVVREETTEDVEDENEANE